MIMNWNKVVFAIIIILLYIPLVFMGTNILFPKYDYGDFPIYKDCYGGPRAVPVEQADNVTTAEFEKCQQEEQHKQMNFQREKNKYDGWKYLAIVLFNLVVVLITLFIKFNDSIMYGLFIGATVSTFISTVIYFTTRSKIGFGVLVLVFIATLYFITRMIKKEKHEDKKGNS